VGRAFKPAACFQQALPSPPKSRPEGGCLLIARPTLLRLPGAISKNPFISRDKTTRLIVDFKFAVC
jgi:hypothetical protein